MIVQDILDEVRSKLDDVAKARWDDPELIAHVNDCENFITINRPETLLRSNGTMVTRPAVSNLSDTLTLTDKFKMAFVAYVLSKALSKYASNRQDTVRARDELVAFKIELGIG